MRYPVSLRSVFGHILQFGRWVSGAGDLSSPSSDPQLGQKTSSLCGRLPPAGPSLGCGLRVGRAWGVRVLVRVHVV